MATRWSEEQNGVVANFVADGGVVHRQLVNPNGRAILEQNREVRKSGVRKMDWGRQVAEIPVADLEVLRKFFGPALFNDKHHKLDRKIAREAFLSSPASDPYRLEYRRRKQLS